MSDGNGRGDFDGIPLGCFDVTNDGKDDPDGICEGSLVGVMYGLDDHSSLSTEPED